MQREDLKKKRFQGEMDMMARPNVNKLWTIRILLATVVMTTATAMAQQPVSGVCRNGRCSDGAGPGAATGNDYSRRATQSSREWSDVAADDSMLSRTFRPVSSDRSLDFPDPADRLSGAVRI